MIHQRPTDQTREWAALYALDALDGEERQAFERHLEEGCPSCQAELKGFESVAGQLVLSAKPATPPSNLESKLIARIRSNAESMVEESQTPQARTPTDSPGSTLIRSSDDLWNEVIPGLWVKILYFDQEQGRATALARMEPGCNYLPHRHTKPEEMYVLEGTCLVDGELLQPGDYHRAETGSIHYETSTENGCVMLVIASPENEILESAST